MTHQKTWFTQACLAHSWQSQTEFKWPHLQYVPGYHFMHKHIQKFNTNVQKIKGHFYAPSTSHNSPPAHYPLIIPGFKEFPERSSCASLGRTHSNLGLSGVQGCRSHGINTVILPRALIVHWDVVCWEITGIPAICKGPVTPGPRHPQNPVFSCVLQLSTISESSKNRMFLSCE